MRKMFSKNQIAVIAKSVVDNNEVLSKMYWDNENESLNFRSNVDMYNLWIEESLNVISFSNIQDENEDTLQDKLDAKQDVINLESEYTFGVDLTNHKLYDESKTNLTDEEIASLLENALYWIKKRYISVNLNKYVINNFVYTTNGFEISVRLITCDDGEGNIAVSEYRAFNVSLNATARKYLYSEADL